MGRNWKRTLWSLIDGLLLMGLIGGAWTLALPLAQSAASTPNPDRLDLPEIPMPSKQPTFQNQFCVAPDGRDSNPGTKDRPFATVKKALTVVNPGDVIWLKSGTHRFSEPIRIPAEKSGTGERRYYLWALPGETAVFDYSAVPRGGGTGLELAADYWHLKGLHVAKAGGCGIVVYGNHNIVQQCVASESGDTGIQIWGGQNRGGHNLLLNCDSYKNYDPQTGGENADGFAAKWGVGKGNMIVGCRAWNNSDDGFDTWCAGNAVYLINCWGFRNGYNIWDDARFTGNGNGFKLGRPTGAHVVFRCAAWDNTVRGFDYNGNITGVKVANCTAYKNGYPNRNVRKGKEQNFFFDAQKDKVHWLRNNLSFQGGVLLHPDTDQKNNSWNLDNRYEIVGASEKPGGSSHAVTEKDFRSLDDKGTNGPRGEDGSLPVTDFLRLAPGSKLIDAGIATGQPFHGKAPDLGAFESGGSNPAIPGTRRRAVLRALGGVMVGVALGLDSPSSAQENETPLAAPSRAEQNPPPVTGGPVGKGRPFSVKNYGARLCKEFVGGCLAALRGAVLLERKRHAKFS